MAYGTLKCDNLVFNDGGTDKLITVSGLFFSTSGALAVTGTISGGNVTAPTATFTTLTGTTTAGTTATFASGSFTSLTGVTTTGTTANFVTFNGASGVFTTRVSGTTITGTTANFTSGNFIALSGTTTTVTSGVFGAGSATAPSVAVGTGTSNSPGIYSPGTDQVAISTNGIERARIDSSGRVGIGTSTPTKLLQVVSGPNTSSISNGADLSISTPGLTAAQINSTSIGIGVNGIANNFNGDFHIRAFWGFSIDKGGGNVSSGATNSVNTDSRTFAIRQFAGGTTWDTQFCVNGSGRVGIGISSPTTLLDVNSDTVRLRTARTPASATATGTAGEICWDANYIYVCTATDTWRRTALSSW